MKVGMALPKAVGYIIFLLAIFYSLENQGYRQSLNVFLEDLMGTKASHIHAREKREAALNSSDYVVEAVINISDVDLLRNILSTLSFPIRIDNTVNITSIEATTELLDIDVVLDLNIPISIDPSNFTDLLRDILRSVQFPLAISESLNVTGINFTTGCYPNSTGGLQCQCEENFAWSCDKCVKYGACSDATTQTCDCINGLPTDGQFCEPITNITRCPPPTLELLDIDVVLDLNIPISTDPSNFTDRLRDILRSVQFPLAISGCYPNSTGGLQCQCEENFAWSCDKCVKYGACGDATTQTCDCINGLPTDGQFCEPITNITRCPTPTLELLDIDLVLDLTIPIFSDPSNFTDRLRDILRSIQFPLAISETLNVTGVNFTTGCYPNSTGGLQCQCEENFAWSCDKCVKYGACGDATTQTCDCINGLPTDGQFCEPITNITRCPTPPPVIMTTMTTTTTEMTTTSPSTTPIMTTPTAAPTIIERNFSNTLDIDFNVAYNEPSNGVNQNISAAIERQSKKFFSSRISSQLVSFRSGSTIADYTIRATSFQENEIANFNTGIFTDLAGTYPMIFDDPTTFNFVQPFSGQSVTLTCGPPPSILGFSDNWTAEWTRDGELIRPDSEHIFKRDDEKATLTVLNFFFTNNGLYECSLRDRNVFRQQSNGSISSKVIPSIQVRPVRIKVKCEVGKEVQLECSVNSPYTVEFEGIPSAVPGKKINHTFRVPENCANSEEKFTCQVVELKDFKKEIILELSTDEFRCIDDDGFGAGNVGDKGVASCEPDEVGEKTAVCKENGNWEDVVDNCVLRVIQELFNQSQFLNNNSLPAFLDQLSNITTNFSQQVVESPANINAIVIILSNVANATSSLNIVISETVMEDLLVTAGILTTDGARDSWNTLNSRSTGNSSVTRSNIPEVQSASSSLLLSVENITRNLNDESFDIVTDAILLNKTRFTDSFSGDFNSSVEIEIPEADGGNKSITVITFSSMDNVLPARDEVNSTSNVINGRVVLVQSSGSVNNISFTFDIINDTLGNPQCVFWNFSLFDGLGGWDGEGCELVVDGNETITCNCNHLTSFSILMSPFSPDDPVLDFITYIGVGISMASLVICLIIEAVIWRKIRKNNTSYLRHVSIVNIAVSLLIANIWFIIGAAISDPKEENPPACSAATFFIHFFYLSLFFWMFASALLLLYRTVSVFDGGLSKKSLLAIGFTLGYGAPLIIAVITIAVTAPSLEYIRQNGVCWLNWYESMALLAFVIPALTIVVINLFILIVVIYKMLRRRAVRDAAQAAERHILVVIARSLAVLTPFFGLTWALGVGTMTNPENRGIHISFAFFNSLQGFFILVFGTLLDKKVRSEIAIRSQTSSGGTRSTSAGTSSTSGLGFLRNWRRGRDGYNMSSNDSGVSQSFNT
ncbi:adhesion G protein-coupled receptor F5-like [Seriola lalandi dorsalis]|uniref:adhesion G protein-coupled receptor F5-like n=1 Tax=Seriola lalandi dorsalis TaxID=1841481 RepID=UPI000C6FC317|nr:adhesion G protein-coupled receptor F5-like [Seriola lalandi dorsalis]